MDKSAIVERIVFFTQCANKNIRTLNGLYEEYQSKSQVLGELKDIDKEIAKQEKRREEILREIQSHTQKVYNYSIDLVKLSFWHPLKARRIKKNMANQHSLVARHLEEKREIDNTLANLQSSKMDIYDIYPLLSDKDVQDVKNSYLNDLEDLKTLCETHLAPLTKRDYSNILNLSDRVVPISELSLETELENVVSGVYVSEEFEN